MGNAHARPDGLGPENLLSLLFARLSRDSNRPRARGPRSGRTYLKPGLANSTLTDFPKSATPGMPKASGSTVCWNTYCTTVATELFLHLCQSLPRRFRIEEVPHRSMPVDARLDVEGLLAVNAGVGGR
eukprot:3414587-Alexandrium_andersonii.AAC.1